MKQDLFLVTLPVSVFFCGPETIRVDFAILITAYWYWSLRLLIHETSLAPPRDTFSVTTENMLCFFKLCFLVSHPHIWASPSKKSGKGWKDGISNIREFDKKMRHCCSLNCHFKAMSLWWLLTQLCCWLHGITALCVQCWFSSYTLNLKHITVLYTDQP